MGAGHARISVLPGQGEHIAAIMKDGVFVKNELGLPDWG